VGESARRKAPLHRIMEIAFSIVESDRGPGVPVACKRRRQGPCRERIRLATLAPIL